MGKKRLLVVVYNTEKINTKKKKNSACTEQTKKSRLGGYITERNLNVTPSGNVCVTLDSYIRNFRDFQSCK